MTELEGINTTELVQMCRSAGLGNLSRGSRESLYDALLEDNTTQCPLNDKRTVMENHIRKEYHKLRTQLPGCTGKCTTYGCTDVQTLCCWEAIKAQLL